MNLILFHEVSPIFPIKELSASVMSALQMYCLEFMYFMCNDLDPAIGKQSFTSSSFASKYCKYCCGKISLKPSKKACVCSSTPRDSLHSATSLETKTHQDHLNGPC